MGFSDNHKCLYFDGLCRTKKAESVLSMIFATYETKINIKDVTKQREVIAQKLLPAYELFKFDVGTYSGSAEQFSKQYTIGLELGIWKNSDLDLSPLALKVAKGEIGIKEYFDIVFLNYIQPINGIIVNPLYKLLQYMKDNNLLSISYDTVASAFEVKDSKEREHTNAFYNFMIGTTYFTEGKNCLILNRNIEDLLQCCNLMYVGKEYEEIKPYLIDQNDFAKYLQIDNRLSSLKNNRNNILSEKVDLDDLTKLFQSWLTSKLNKEAKPNSSYAGYASKLREVIDYIVENSLLDSFGMYHLDSQYYQNVKELINTNNDVKKIDEIWAFPGRAATRLYIVFINQIEEYGFDTISNAVKNKLEYDDVIVTKKNKIDDINYSTGIMINYARNRIVFGAPGTGKSFTLNSDIKDLLSNGGNFERVTFHPDYTYANFVGTYKPVPDPNDDKLITYKYVPGPFMRILVKAIKSILDNDVKPYVLLIEEINRSNVAAVFGDVFQLLDRDEDNKSMYPINTSEDVRKYLEEEFKDYDINFNSLSIPDNMLIWSSMNSADQGVFPMDTAFKRRWNFEYINIDDNEKKIENYNIRFKSDGSQEVNWNKLRKSINVFLSSNRINEDKLLGPFFINEKDLKDDSTFKEIFKNKVLMYLFEDAAKQKRDLLFSSLKSKSEYKNCLRYSDICKEFDSIGIDIFAKEIVDNAK